MRKPADPRFDELLALLRADQSALGLGFESRPGAGRHGMVMLLRGPVDAEMGERHARIRTLLGLKNARSFDVSYGTFPTGEEEIAILSRSMLQVMLELSAHIEMPEVDVAEGRVQPTPTGGTTLLRVRSGETAPEDAYVSVRYRNRAFWIDDRDHTSKSLFSFLMLMFSLTETANTQAAPVLTVPAR